jgi:hypothetical protein
LKALPKRLCISIGGFFGPSYEVRFKKGRLTYTYWPPRESFSRDLEGPPEPEWRELLGLKPLPKPEEIQPFTEQWRNFRKTLDRIDVWCWKCNYSDSNICDGTGWSAEIVYSDQSIVSSGDNCFPGRDGRAMPVTDGGSDNTFEKFCRAVAQLIGRQFH